MSLASLTASDSCDALIGDLSSVGTMHGEGVDGAGVAAPFLGLVSFTCATVDGVAWVILVNLRFGSGLGSDFGSSLEPPSLLSNLSSRLDCMVLGQQMCSVAGCFTGFAFFLFYFIFQCTELN